MATEVNINQEMEVDVEIQLEGTFYNHLVLVEDQHISTNQDDDSWSGKETIILNGDPIKLMLFFRGEAGSKIKSFKISMN